MFNFFKRKKDTATEVVTNYVTMQTASKLSQEADQKFAKPDTYTGNRKLYDSGTAKIKAKRSVFSHEKVYIDKYTQEPLVLTKKEAKALYGKEWTKHLAEADHIKSLENIYQDTKNNAWNTVEDIKEAVNSDANLSITSRKFNNAKRQRNNREFVEDEAYLKSKGIELTKQGKEAAIRDELYAEKAIKNQLRNSAIKNIALTGHEAGLQGAKNSSQSIGTLSTIRNVVDVVNGNKDSGEAISDIIKDSGQAALEGYVKTGALTVVNHSLSASSKFGHALVQANVPGKILTAVCLTGTTLKKWSQGDITTQECLIQLGDKGVNFAATGYAATVGGTIAGPIGGIVGALVGSALASEYYQNLICKLQVKELEHQERMHIIAECKEAAKQAEQYREELEVYFDNYFAEYQGCFDEALSSMKFAFQVGDADGIISSANKITRKLGGRVYYDNMEEFKAFLDSDTIDIL